jgi:hypothetical protein
VKFRQTETKDFQANVPTVSTESKPVPDNSNKVDVANPGPESVVSKPAQVASNTVKPRPRYSAPKAAPVNANHVQLLPGERSYLQAIARLDSTIKQNKSPMRPSLQVEYERNLAVVDRAIAATRNAAKKNPDDPDAADFMFAAYQSKVDLLNTIADARLSGGRSH